MGIENALSLAVESFLVMSVATTMPIMFAAGCSYKSSSDDIEHGPFARRLLWLVFAAWTTFCGWGILQPVHSETGFDGRGCCFMVYVPLLAALSVPLVKFFAQWLGQGSSWILFLTCFSVGHLLGWLSLSMARGAATTGTGPAIAGGAGFVFCPLAGIVAFASIAAVVVYLVGRRQPTS